MVNYTINNGLHYEQCIVCMDNYTIKVISVGKIEQVIVEHRRNNYNNLFETTLYNIKVPHCTYP